MLAAVLDRLELHRRPRCLDLMLRDEWFTSRSRAVAVVAVDVDESDELPVAVISTGTVHEERPALSVLRPCEAPGPYPRENEFVKIREL